MSQQQADVQLESVTKAYGDVVAVDDLALEVAPGEFFTMLGPSGSGKTTTLRLIAGFELPDEGRVVALLLVLGSAIPVYIAQRLTTEAAVAAPGAAAAGARQ